MSCSSNNSCNNSNSLFGRNRNNQYIKFSGSSQGASISAINGANTVSKMELCDFRKDYKQFFNSTMYLEAGALDRELQYGGLGSQIEFLAIKITYTNAQKSTTCKCSAPERDPTPLPTQELIFNNGYEGTPPVTPGTCVDNPVYDNDCCDTYANVQTQYKPNSNGGCGCGCSSSKKEPFTIYKFSTEPNTERYIDDLMILTGNESAKIPKIFLSNPNSKMDAVVEIMASTNSITFDDLHITEIGDDTITVENMVYTNLTSDSQNLYVNSSSGTGVTIRWRDILSLSTEGDFEINGRIITVNDYVQGTINLSFVSEYHAKQAYSLMKWAICDLNTNLITGSQEPDHNEPEIIYSTNFSTEIILAEFPPMNTSTCGTAGTSLCDPVYIGTTQGVILKEDLFTYLVDYAIDNRDCNLDFDYNNLTIQKVESNLLLDSITELGKYHITFEVRDNADNILSDSYILNVKDTGEPKLIVSDLGLELHYAYMSTSGTSGTAGIEYINLNPDSYVFLEDMFEDTHIRFNSTCGEIAYVIFKNTVIEVGSYESSTSGLCHFTFDNHQVGNGVLEWNPDTEIGVSKLFILNGDFIEVVFNGLGSFLFSVKYATPDDPLIGDENGFLLGDENDNFITG